MQDVLFFDYLNCPIGVLKITASSEAITSIRFCEIISKRSKFSNPNKITSMAQKQLKEYFNHERTEFSLPLSPQRTPFQQKVWNALESIPYGKVSTYKEVAVMIGNSKAVRAVGNANSKNPITIVIPCHRVIQSNGKLGGYAGGLYRKQWLLKHENPQKIFEN
ncbi:MAG: cysteine methyltransferase [Promethearchaeia archaeon]|nr:MAG: cysteine methyltransferase [Candidatus Lokiarchaeia archaeon]